MGQTWEESLRRGTAGHLSIAKDMAATGSGGCGGGGKSRSKKKGTGAAGKELLTFQRPSDEI